MEELAESHGCVKKVKELEREDSWQNKEIVRRFRNVFTNLACGYGGHDKGSTTVEIKKIQRQYHELQQQSTGVNGPERSCR